MGPWVDVKENALAVLPRMCTPARQDGLHEPRHGPVPADRALAPLVRGLLEELVCHRPRLVVQTRSQLVTRELDLLRKLDHVRVKMTVTMDSERVRRAFQP